MHLASASYGEAIPSANTPFDNEHADSAADNLPAFEVDLGSDSQLPTRVSRVGSLGSTESLLVASASEHTHESDGMVVVQDLPPAPSVQRNELYDHWLNKYIRTYQGGLYVAYNGGSHHSPQSAVTVSEATGYGLLVAVLHGNRELFDGLLRFWRKFLTEHGLMYWQLLQHKGVIQPNNGSLNSATDGDMDTAFALFIAADLWDEPEYEKAAIDVCAALISQCYNPETQLLTLGDWCIDGHPLHDAARPSDFLLSHLTLFACRDEERAATWTAILEATVQAVQAQFDQNPTGLMADFVMYNHDTCRYEPVKGQVLERPQDPEYFFNSCRIPWRLAIYYAESGDERVLPVLRALVAFFEDQEIIYAGYSLSGTSFVKYSHLAFTAPVHCLFQVMQSPHLERVTAIMTAMGRGTYFGDTIQLLCALQCEHLKNGAIANEACHPPHEALLGGNDGARSAPPKSTKAAIRSRLLPEKSCTN